MDRLEASGHAGEFGHRPSFHRALTVPGSPSTRAQAYKDDPEFARSEYGAEWRRDISSLLDIEVIENAVDEKIFERPHEEGISYIGFIDPSGGKSDSFCCALAHQDKETKRIILDVLREARPPFRPESVVEEYSQVLKDYGITFIKSDIYGGEWVTSAFKNHGITVERAKMNKSDYYLNALPLFNNGSIRLLDQERLKNQLMSLERKVRSGSRDAVDNFHGHDDLSNCACACLVESQEKDSGFGLVCIGDIVTDDNGWHIEFEKPDKETREEKELEKEISALRQRKDELERELGEE